MTNPPATPAAVPTETQAENVSDAASARTGNPAHTLLWIALLVVLGAAGAGGYWLYRELRQADQKWAQVQHNDSTQLAAQLAQTQQLSQRVDQFDGKLNQFQTTQQTLQQQYQNATRDQNAWTLTEVGQLLTTANDQLQLTGNIQPALLALHTADTRLAALTSPQALAVRQAVQRDIARLQAAPQTNLTGLTIKLDTLLDQVDSLPLQGEANPALKTASAALAAPATSASRTATPATWSLQTSRTWLTEFGNDLLGHLRGLVQVRSLDNADGLLIAPQQDAYLRENLKLRLLSARLSLLMRNPAVFKADISAASTALTRYFDPDSAQVQNMQSILRQLKQAVPTSSSLPDLSDSLAAVRQSQITENRSPA